MLEYQTHVDRLAEEEPTLSSELGHSDSLENVLLWLQRQNLPPDSVDLVAQDEFSYDFLIRLAEQRWLVFGVN